MSSSGRLSGPRMFSVMTDTASARGKPRDAAAILHEIGHTLGPGLGLVPEPLHQPIGVKIDAVPRLDGAFDHPELNRFENAQDVPFGREQGGLAIGADEDGRGMPAIDQEQPLPGPVEAQQGGCQVLAVAQQGGKHAVHVLERFKRGVQRSRILAQQGLERGSHKGGPQVVAGNVGHEIAHDGLGPGKDIVKVAAGFQHRHVANGEPGLGHILGSHQGWSAGRRAAGRAWRPAGPAGPGWPGVGGYGS